MVETLWEQINLFKWRKNMSEKKGPPGAIKRASNFAHAVAKHARDGFVDVSTEEYIKRI